MPRRGEIPPLVTKCKRGYQIVMTTTRGKKQRYGCFTKQSGAQHVLDEVRRVLPRARRWYVKRA